MRVSHILHCILLLAFRQGWFGGQVAGMVGALRVSHWDLLEAHIAAFISATQVDLVHGYLEFGVQYLV